MFDELVMIYVFFDSKKVGEDFISKALNILHYEYKGDVEDEEDGSVEKFYLSEEKDTRIWWGMNSKNYWYLHFEQMYHESSPSQSGIKTPISIQETLKSLKKIDRNIFTTNMKK